MTAAAGAPTRPATMPLSKSPRRLEPATNTELTAPTRVACVADGLKRLGVPPEQRKYFQLHAALDVEHSRAWNAEALRPLVEENPGCAQYLAEGAVMRLVCGEQCFEAYRIHLWAHADPVSFAAE